MGSKRQGDVVISAGFDGLPISVNWLECANGSKDDQIERVRGVLRSQLRRLAGLAELNVGVFRSLATCLDVVEDSLDASGQWPAAPCHAEIVGIPEDQSKRKLVFEKLADNVIKVYPAVKPDK